MSLGPNFNVWMLGRGGQGKWKLQHSTSDLGDAMSWFAKLDAAGKQVAIYELGSFMHNDREVAGQVGFWWNAALNDYMTCEPLRRGIGWTEDYDTWVEYEFPAVTSSPAADVWGAPAVIADEALESTLGDQELAYEPEERFADATCEHCGLILPMNQLKRLTHDVETGHTSGSRSTSHRSSRHGTSFSRRGTSFSNSNGSGHSSSSSSRTYYKTETLLLCHGCFERQTRADHPILSFLRRVLE